MSSPYLFDNAVLDRHAKQANGIAVEGAFEFADRLMWLISFPSTNAHDDDVRLDSFLDRKRAFAPIRSEAGGARTGLLFVVVLVAAAWFGWTHSSTAPNGATVLAIEVLAVAIAVPTIVIRASRRTDRAAAARTAKIEGRLEQDTTGDHIWDA